MKILNVVSYWGEKYGGIYYNVKELTRALRKKGHEVSILSTGNKSKKEPIICKRIDDYFFFSPELVYESKIIKDYDVVLIHGLWTFPVLYTSRFCKKNNIPYIVFTHMMLSPWSLNFKHFRKTIAYYLYQKGILKNARYLALIDDSEKLFLNHKKINTPVFNFKSALRKESIPNEKKFKKKTCINLLFLGRIHPKKGLDFLIKSLRYIKSDVKLVVSGNGEDMGYYHKIKRFVIKNNLPVEFTGPVTGKIKHKRLKEADIFILPSFDDGTPVSMLEAMSYSLSLIISKGCNMPEIHNKMGFLVRQNPKEIAEKIDKLNSLKLRKKFGKNAFNFVKENFMWDKQADNILKWIQ